MTAAGRVVRFEESHGYGFIAPCEGGDDVFVHASDFGEQRHLVRPGVQVEYQVEVSDRGLRVRSVRVLDRPAPGAADPADDGMCDVLAPGELTSELTETLLRSVPSLTGQQIIQVRRSVVALARSHGWAED